MFRKFTDKLSEAANTVIGGISGNHREGVQALMSMGFSEGDARNALGATSGNVDQAAELLLASVSAPGPTSRQNTNNNNQATNDGDHHLNAALQESLQTEEARQLEAARISSKESAAKAPIKSAAASRAGQAAVERAANGTNSFPTAKVEVCAHHPAVKVPAKLQHKSKEEQLLRCADRMKNHPKAVDTIYIALTSIQKDPNNDKFRKIDKTNAGYQRALAKAPGAEDMFKAMSFRERGPNSLVLARDQVDPALLYLGISALETTRQTEEYKEAKRLLQFEKEVSKILSQSDASEQEAIKRANYMSKCPTEPSDGRGALMQVKIADETVRRRFDGDDTLIDILSWLGGHASSIPEKVLGREWSLVDCNRYPVAPIDCEEHQHKTLQYIGCWPSGKLEVLPSTEEWRLHKKADVAGSARGLGAAKLH